VTVAASTVAVDVTGILLASLVLGVGFLIIPARRRRAKATLQEKLTSLRGRLTSALTTEFARAQVLSAQRLEDLVAPYGRFVRSEEGRWRDAEQALTALRQRTAALLSQQGNVRT
jgi:ABC-type transport system involved in cytochrome bd biosynthesis fused ATPase/permease subunit